MNLGVIDLGSNTIRLCVYEVVDGSIKTIVNRKQMAGLASYVVDGAITQEGIDVAIRILRKQLKRATYFDPERVDIFATAVLRNISNSKEAVNAIGSALDVPVRLLSDEDEAHLGFVGASYGNTLDCGVLVDIGGGSSEVTVIRKGAEAASVSVSQGSLSSFEDCVSDILPTCEEVAAIRSAFRKRFTKVAKDADVAAKDFRADSLFGIGGSVRAVAEVCEHLSAGSDGKVLTRDDILYLFGCLTADRRRFIQAVLRTAPERMHTVVCGLSILAELFDITGAQRLSVCKNGLREGYLIERMLKWTAR